MYRVSDALRQQAWDNTLREQSLVRDIFVALTGTYIDEPRIMPSDVIFDVQNSVTVGANSVTVGLLMNLSGSGTYGNTSLLGREEDQVVKNVQLYSNEVKHGVPTEQFGYYAWLKRPYNVVGMVQPQLSRWHMEERGFLIRTSLCELYSKNLVSSPVSLTQGINSSIYFAGVAAASQPVYSATLATYVQNIATIAAAITSSPTAANQLCLDVLNNVASYAATVKQIEGINLNGETVYVMTIPSTQAIFMRNPQTTANGGSLANIARDADVRDRNNNQSYVGFLFNWGPLMLIEDPRAPRVTITNSSATVTFSYYEPGNTDNRATPGTTVWDVSFLLGRAALGLFTMEQLHFEDEDQDYGRIKSIGAFANYGYNLMQYNDSTPETPSASTLRNQGSMLVLMLSKLT
jgi:hypothetical protein